MINYPDAIQPIRAALCRDSSAHLSRPRRSGRLAVKGFLLHHPSPHRQSPHPDESWRWLLHHRRRQRDAQQLAHRSGSHRRCQGSLRASSTKRCHHPDRTPRPAYGERQYNAQDFYGHRWDFTETITDVGGWPILSPNSQYGLPHPPHCFCGRVGLPDGIQSA